MRFVLTAEQQTMRDAVQRLVDRTIQPELDRHDRNAPLPKPVFLMLLGKLAELGLPAARLPESAGGPGITMLDYGIALEPIPAPIAVSLVAQEATIARLYAECTDEQRDRLLPGLIAGRKIACTGSTEPDTGSDPRGVRTRLTRRGDTLLLNGRKMWITNVSACDVIMVTCLDQRDGAGGKVIKVVVEPDRSPFEAREIETIGLRQGMLGECVFEDCAIPAENVIEATRGGTEVLKASWGVNRPLFGLIAVGLAQRAYRHRAALHVAAPAVRQADRRASACAEEPVRHRHRHHREPAAVLPRAGAGRSRARTRRAPRRWPSGSPRPNARTRCSRR